MPSHPHQGKARRSDTFARPVDFDPAELPIIAQHYGVEPLRPIGEIAVEAVVDLRFQRQVKRLHRLGTRAVGEACRPCWT